jgi:hypothetical protein
MRALTLPWSRAFNLVCEVALSLRTHQLQISISHDTAFGVMIFKGPKVYVVTALGPCAKRPLGRHLTQDLIQDLSASPGPRQVRHLSTCRNTCNLTKAGTPSAPRLHFLLRRHSHARRAAGLRNCPPLPSRTPHPHPLLHIPDRLSEPVHRSLAVSGHRETYCWGFRRPRIVQICCVVVVVRLVGQVLRRDGVR